MAVLDRRLAKKGNCATVFVLIQWANGSKDDANGNPLRIFNAGFLHLIANLEVKIVFKGEGMLCV